MKSYIMILVMAAGVTFLCAPDVNAFPGERMPYRAAHFAGNVVHKIDRHVIHPVRRGIVNHTPHR